MYIALGFTSIDTESDFESQIVQLIGIYVWKICLVDSEPQFLLI